MHDLANFSAFAELMFNSDRHSLINMRINRRRSRETGEKKQDGDKDTKCRRIDWVEKNNKKEIMRRIRTRKLIRKWIRTKVA